MDTLLRATGPALRLQAIQYGAKTGYDCLSARHTSVFASPARTIMSFRHVRKSNDGYLWVALVLCGCGLLAFTLPLFQREPSFPIPFFVVGLGICAAGFLWCLRAVLRPFAWELVVEGNRIRWGRVDRPDQQQSVNVSELSRLVYSKSDFEILGDVGRFQMIYIGTGILIRHADQAALVDYLRQSYPDLKIETT